MFGYAASQLTASLSVVNDFMIMVVLLYALKVSNLRHMLPFEVVRSSDLFDLVSFMVFPLLFCLSRF